MQHTYHCWIKIDKLDGTCFIISPFTAQHVSNVSTFIFRSLRLIVDLFHVLYCSGSALKSTISRKLLKMDVLTFETCWAVNSEIIKRVTSSWSIFIQQFFILIFFYVYLFFFSKIDVSLLPFLPETRSSLLYDHV